MPTRLVAPVVMALLVVSTASAQVLRYDELTASGVARLDGSRTVVVIPGGIIEEHGPYLPNGADGARNQRIADDLARDIAARAGWAAVVLPMVPLGTGGFNGVVGHPSFSGTLSVRTNTLRAVFSDLADALGGQGFRWVFVVHGHGDPNHNRALDDAGDYFRATYAGTMVHLLGRHGCQAESIEGGKPPASLYGAEAQRLDAESPHAGALESARTLYLGPHLVDTAGLRRAPDVTARDLDEWRRAAAVSGWSGYVGAPRFATRELGKWIMASESRGCLAVARRILDGTDEASIGRYADRMLSIPPVRAAADTLLRTEAAQEDRQDRWRAARARP